jgi:hypothetical protein
MNTASYIQSLLESDFLRESVLSAMIKELKLFKGSRQSENEIFQQGEVR